jgi:DNA-3-methyladenine glycosylase I
MPTTPPILRCFGNTPGQSQLARYHDDEWGVPVHDDKLLFEMLTLEGAQAGLNWEIVLKKRSGYRVAFFNYDLRRIATMTDEELDTLRSNPEIIRNRLKIFSVRKNARACINIQDEFGSFAAFLWAFVDHAPQINHWPGREDIPATTPVSDALSKALKTRGMSFVGSTIVYAYMQAVGLVNDHYVGCWRHGRYRE